jgi:hypothetical protein
MVMHDIGNLGLLSLEATMKLFSSTITQILTHCLEYILDNLTENDFATIENAKATYLTSACFLKLLFNM